jgi:hypothetical protein
MPPPATVLNRGEKARLDHGELAARGAGDARSHARAASVGVGADPGPIERRRSIARGDGAKPDLVPGREQRRRNARCIEDLERRAADQLPAAWGVARIDTGLTARNANRSRWNPDPRRGAPRRCDRFVDDAQVRKPGQEPEHVDAVRGGGVAFDDVLHRDASPRGHVLEVGTMFPAVHHRHLYAP